ncbi:hypothetical protein HYY75_05280 [bacterium]|nr:hypothetical protein [bacterium]
MKNPFLHKSVLKKKFLVFFCFSIQLTFTAVAVPPSGPNRSTLASEESKYFHGGVTKTIIGAYEEQFFLFEPNQPVPSKAPLIIFLHGWFSPNPEFYLGWVEHLCRSGWIVFFPCYQGGGELPQRFSGNAIRSLKEALGILRNGFHVWPDIDRVAIIGHESGGVVGANMAAAPRYFKIPIPSVLMLVEPSRGMGGENDTGIDFFDLSGIRANTLMLVIVGEHDFKTGQKTAKEIFYQADQIESRNKNFITLLTDLYGNPALVGDKFAPFSPLEPIFEREAVRRRTEFVKLYRSPMAARAIRSQGIDAMDFLGTWRLFDSLSKVSFEKGDRSESLGDTEKQRFIGNWSDGRLIRGLLATERP